MKTIPNDQWFEPGDKVTRVSRAIDLGMTPPPSIPRINGTGYGRILCVERCSTSTYGNLVRFVGITHYAKGGCLARCFRKVEEIRLCVEALEKAKQAKRDSMGVS
jgi:hypothetical protein